MKAVIYARYSSDNQREESIEGQLRECKEYAEKNGITILCSYIDRALSAKTDNRPEFQNMVQDSAKGLFDTVLVWKLDRFARNRYDSAHYKAILRRNGVKVVSATENISDGPEGIILESMLEEMAELSKALLKLRRAKKHEITEPLFLVKNVEEEIADVQIVLNQMKLLFPGWGIWMQAKLQRLEERIEKERWADADEGRTAGDRAAAAGGDGPAVRRPPGEGGCGAAGPVQGESEAGT